MLEPRPITRSFFIVNKIVEEDKEWENGADEEMEVSDGVDLSSINSMMSTVMKAAQLNGGVDSAPTTPNKVSVKSPGTNRSGRKNQVILFHMRLKIKLVLCSDKTVVTHKLFTHYDLNSVKCRIHTYIPRINSH